MAWRRYSLAKRSASVGDTYRSLSDLLGLAPAGSVSGFRVPNGLLWALTNGFTVAYGPQPSDLSTGVGGPVAAGDTVGLQSDIEAAWDLSEVWLRNTTPASVAVAYVAGPVLREV